MSVCCECCVLSGRGLCDELITRLEESYRVWRVVVCDIETSWMKGPWPNGRCRAKNEQTCNDPRVRVIISQFLRPLGLHINFLKPRRDRKSGKSVFLVVISGKTPTNNLSPYSQFSLKLCTCKPPGTLIESDSTICCMCTTVSSWRWALEARNM